MLRIYRGGATRTPTRRLHQGELGCQVCGDSKVRPSLKHYVVECVAYHGIRDETLEKFGLDMLWLRAQPRVTTKSRWITRGAGTNVEDRAKKQIAVCCFAIRVLFASMARIDDYIATQLEV
jgi:hypothetical protein